MNTINRIKYGDECTKYFHSMATISYRRNLNAPIQDDYGVSLINDEEKANHLWCVFKDRMGKTSFANMEFDLGSMVHVSTELADLASPFLVAEIDNIVKSMPSDKAPGPHGFNGAFIKKCWPIIKEDLNVGQPLTSHRQACRNLP